ncbi:hypothetical protein H6F95_00175 [Cyanobacteria bacterium FACHB-471]|nr:hypothetical protein [Cyanobacteria bacterium FACHB-471]
MYRVGQYRIIRASTNITTDANHTPATGLRIAASKLPVAATIDPEQDLRSSNLD